MNKHLQQKQLYDSFLNEENFDNFLGDEPCLDPDCVEEESIYDMINEEEFDGESMNELDLDDYDDFMIL